MKKKPLFITIAVLGLYLFYITPLFYSADSAQEEELSGNQPGITGADSRQVALNQALLRELSLKKEGRSSEAASPRVFLNKKRALPASLDDIIEKMSRQAATASDHELFFERRGVFFHMPGESPANRCGFQFYHSGTSPPSA